MGKTAIGETGTGVGADTVGKTAVGTTGAETGTATGINIGALNASAISGKTEGEGASRTVDDCVASLLWNTFFDSLTSLDLVYTGLALMFSQVGTAGGVTASTS